MKALNVLSLFNGISCGRIALERAGIPVENYHESEIDKYAGKASAYNWPDSVQIGDVCKVVVKDLPFVPDLLIAGSPCQGFSFAGKQLNFNDPRSKLFFEFVRILKDCQEINPNVLFMLENVPMKKEFQRVINDHLGIYPCEINGALVSAQSRNRLFWTNIRTKTVGLFGEVHSDIPHPADKGILLSHILESEVDEKYFLSEKALARIERSTYSQAKVNPDKTGTINTKNNSGQLSIDSGTTLIGVVNDNGNLREVSQANCIDARYSKGMDNHGQRTLAVVVQKIDVNGNLKANQDKAVCFTAGANSAGNHSQMDFIAQSVQLRPRYYNDDGAKKYGKEPGFTRNGTLEFSGDGTKVGTITRNEKVNLVQFLAYNPNGGSYHQSDRVNMPGNKSRAVESHASGGFTGKCYDYSRIRRLTPTEVCRLFNVPDGYFHDKDGKRLISESQQYKCLGNGWVVDVIAHIFSFIPEAISKQSKF